MSKSIDLLRANPSIILIQLVPAVPALIGDVAGSGVFNPIRGLATLLSAILSVIATGAYAPVVKEALGGQRLTLGQALGQAYHRFWSLLAAGILVVIIVVLGSILFIVPGIIFATWYFYTAPAIMLENKGALEGMSASKAFGRDKKGSTFLVFLAFLLAYLIVAIIGAVLSLGGGGRVISTLVEIPVEAWTSVVIAYIYIVHGPQPIAPPGPQQAWQGPSPAPAVAPGMPATAPATGSRFCAYCGSPLKPDAKFCGNCGSPV